MSCGLSDWIRQFLKVIEKNPGEVILAGRARIKILPDQLCLFLPVER